MVELIFFCWLRRLLLPVAIYFGSCFVMKYLLGLVHLGKCPLLMVWMSVEGTGIYILMCRKAASFDLVSSDWMALQEKLCGLLVVWYGGGSFWSRGLYSGH